MQKATSNNNHMKKNNSSNFTFQMYNTHPGRPRTAQRPAPWSPYQVNGLFVTADFDLRVIDFQLGGSALVCGFGPDNAGIAAWPGATC
jgi:hypothetical protein